VIISAHLANGEALPFGAEVFNEEGISLGVTGQSGKALVRGVNPAGQLTARWQDDDGSAKSCSFTYRLQPKVKGKPAKAYEEIGVTCRPADAVALAARSGT
jgi:outer membrane usher protein